MKCLVRNYKHTFLINNTADAAHETIKLERLQNELLDALKDGLNQENITPMFLRSLVSITLKLSGKTSIRNRQSQFLRTGVRYFIQNKTITDRYNNCTLLVQSLSSLFVKLNRDGFGYKPILTLSTKTDFFNEHLKWLSAVGIISLTVILLAFNTVLCSHACHEAIRFGNCLN